VGYFFYLAEVESDQAVDLRIILAFLSVYIIWGSTYLFIYYSIQTIPPLIMAGVRFCTVGSLLFGWTYYIKKEKYSLAVWKFGIVSGSLLFLVGNGALVLAQQHLPSGLVSIMAGTVPFWILILDSRSGTGRFRNGLTWLGLFLGFGGLILLFADKLSMRAQETRLTLSYLLMIFGALAWTGGTLYSKYTQVSASTNARVAVQTLTAGSLFLIITLFRGDWLTFDWQLVSVRSFLSLVYLIFFGSMIGYYSFLWLLSKVSAHAVSTHAFVNPLVAVALGSMFAGEHFEAKEILALICIIGGLISIYFSKNKWPRWIKWHPK
jgi:drug/metabolite transporter (DMT)-like permease